MNLSNFFTPKSIAIIGASDHEKKVGGILMKKLSDFKGEIIPINPKHNEILGKRTYSSIRNYRGRVDLAIIAIPSEFVNNALEECGKKGINSVIIISAGFSEIGNIEGEKQIIATAKKYGIRFIGPNCFGITNPSINLDTTFAARKANSGNIAFISQSGALWSYIADLAENKIGFSKFISLGNMADLDFSDFIEYLNHDPKTKKIILYVERLKQGKRFIEVCKKSRKQIIAVKAGRTKEGSQAAVSHTGSLATSYAIYRGAFKQAGVILNKSLSGAFGFPKSEIKPKGRRIIILTNAGGAGALMTDYFETHGYDVIRQPIDLLGTATAEDYKNALNKLKEDNSYSTIVLILTPQAMSEPKETAEEIVEFSKTTKREIIGCFLGKRSIKEAEKILKEHNIPVYTHCY